jgi:serine/threonine protein phosphatase PrpC
MKLEIKGATDLGRKRPVNEDSHAWWVPSAPEELSRRGILLVVADGMGGAQAGERASRIAVETVLRRYRDASAEDPLKDLQDAVEEANAAIHSESVTQDDKAGMGTTCTAVVVLDDDTLVAHVGDSRAYLIQDGEIRQLTHDHSLVQHLVERGQITAEEARVDPRRNVVTRSVGVSPVVEVDAERFTGLLRPGDTLVLCSDGLHGLVSDAELAELVGSSDLDEACRLLITLANGRGGHDNITILLARVVPETS